MRLGRAAILGLPLLVAAACQPAPEPDPTVDEAVIRQEVDARREAFAEGALTNDAEVFLSFWTDDMHILEPGIDMGSAEWRTTVMDIFSGVQFLALELRPADVFVHDDVVYEFGRYDETLLDENQDTTEVAGIYSARWEKGSDGLWRLDRVVAGPRNAPEEM